MKSKKQSAKKSDRKLAAKSAKVAKAVTGTSSKSELAVPKADVKNAVFNDPKAQAALRRIPMLIMLFAYSNTILVSLFLGATFIAQGLSVTDNPADITNSFSLFGVILVTALIMLLVLRYYKGKLFFKLLELSFVFSSALVIGSLFLTDTQSWELAFVLAAIRYFFPSKSDVLLYGSAAVFGALLGSSLDIVPAIIFAVLLGAYDYYAVFKSKHMIELAKSLNSRDANFSIKAGTPGNTIELGLGDFVVGAAVSVSALRITAFPDFGAALACALGASFGLSVMFYYLEKKHGYFPAVPPIVCGSLLCLGVYLAMRAVFFPILG